MKKGPTKAERRKLLAHRQQVGDQIQRIPERWGTLGNLCEGQAYQKHLCDDVRELNEVIYPRNIFQKRPLEERLEFHHEFNCMICCRFFHQDYGHRTKFRAWFLRRMIRIYTGKVFKEWNDALPLMPENRVKLP